jgi:predicted heme/steroid binding protein
MTIYTYEETITTYSNGKRGPIFVAYEALSKSIGRGMSIKLALEDLARKLNNAHSI